MVDTCGLPLLVILTHADLTDRNPTKVVRFLFRLRFIHPETPAVWADSAYAGHLVDGAKMTLQLTINVGTRQPGHLGILVLPRRWIVERSLPWITRARRNVRDYEWLPQHSATHITWGGDHLADQMPGPGPSRNVSRDDGPGWPRRHDQSTESPGRQEILRKLPKVAPGGSHSRIPADRSLRLTSSHSGAML